ncbi:hypothetical protein JQ596_29670 [Bradyrhizobium manausense]|uniref:hypothetical protein n=1 Tax=Bradyrhizobium TaxID=374 RepID=UPI001BAA933B|nr:MULTISPECIES: hypothetical protein [Bradyrhizobium]MBR0829709.1 hypothetical protein [Bradyrhizobium manausense]UVO25325.1 hypothetical protein KUF59_22205 [Bradyrhizobium arachidis]
MAEHGTRLRRETLAVVMALACLTLSHSGVTAQKGGAPEVKLEAFDRNNFENSTKIDNKWFPLQPGMQMIYEGFTREEKTRVPHRVVQTVTDLTKLVNGVRAVVVWDVDYKDGEIQESEIVFFAQDKDGNVWQLGELVEVYEEGDFVGAHAWIAGLEGASAGIMMKADPQPGTPSYSQGYAPPPINWSDRAKVDQVGQKTCVPVGCYKDVLVIAESSTKEGPDAQQLKYYAPGVGYIRVGWKGKREKLRETLELREVVKLTPDVQAKARAETLAIEKRAYLYGRTPPAELAQGERAREANER